MGVDVELVLFNLKTYRERVLPAYEAFTSAGDTSGLVSLLREAAREWPSRSALPGPQLWPADVYLEHVEILEGGAAPDGDLPSFVLGVASDLAAFFCVEREQGVCPDHDMTRSALVRYLYDHSDWILDAFTYAEPLTGEPLEIPLGESSELVSRNDLDRLRDEVMKVPRPAGEIQAEYDHLLCLLDTALERPDLGIVLTIS